MAEVYSNYIALAQSTNQEEVRRAMDLLVYATNRDNSTSRRLVDMGLLKIALDIVKQHPVATSAVWDDDSTAEDSHPTFWLAFDVITNLAKWESVRQDLKDAGVVEWLAQLSLKDNYFGFESTEGLAYIVGRDDDGAHSKLLVGRPRNIAKVIEVFKGCVHGDGFFFGMNFGVYGRVLALQSLALADANKKMLKPAIEPMLVVLDSSYDTDSCPLAAQFMLQMTFDDEILAYLRTIPDLETRAAKWNATPETAKLASNFLFRLKDTGVATKPTRKSVTGVTDGHVMISYNWDAQERVRLLVDALRANGLKVWVDFNDMKGDLIEGMAEAVERAAVFVMCLTTKYKESGPCRLEASYAYKHNKLVVPLMMEENFTPSGWLGLLMGNKLYYSYMHDGDAPTIATKVHQEMQKYLNSAEGKAAAANGAGAPSKLQAVKQGPAITSLSIDATAEFFKTKCDAPKIAANAKKLGANGVTLMMIWDVHLKGGAAVTILRELGAKNIVEALSVLAAIKREVESS